MKKLVISALLTISALIFVACGNKGKESVTENTTENDTSATAAPTEGTTATADTGDFEISDPKWFWIKWDADGDGTEEELEFKFQDNGDEAPSVIEVTMYKGDDTITGWIDRAYGITHILAKEENDKPYLEIAYEKGDYYGTGDGVCQIKLENNDIVVTDLGIE